MATTDRPPEVEHLIKALRRADTIQGLPLKRGITERLFAELLARCLLNCKDAAADLKHRREQFRGGAYLRDKRVRSTLRRAAAVEWPPLAREAQRLLDLDGSLRRLGRPYLERAESRARSLDPIQCLYVLFRYLVKLDRTETVEWYMETYFARILAAADIPPDRARTWTKYNVLKHHQRRGGARAARRVAVVLLSAHRALIPYCPHFKFTKVRPMLGAYGLAIQARTTYWEYSPRPAEPLAPLESAGRTTLRQNGKPLSV